MDRLACVREALKDRRGFFKVFLVQADSEAELLGEVGTAESNLQNAQVLLACVQSGRNVEYIRSAWSAQVEDMTAPLLDTHGKYSAAEAHIRRRFARRRL